MISRLHDWTRILDAIYHDFHQCWLHSMKLGLNRGVLPEGYYALVHREETGSFDTFASLGHDRIDIRPEIDDKRIASIELLSPFDKATETGLSDFVRKACESLHAGIQLLVIDPFPPGRYDEYGIHEEIWKHFALMDDAGRLNSEQRAFASYSTDRATMEAFLEPKNIGDEIPDMPLFLSADHYVTVPLARSYGEAIEAMPTVWRNRLTPSFGD